MARKPRVQVAGAIYPVTFRGNARQAIFGDNRDRKRLSERVGESAEEFGVRVYLYGWLSREPLLAMVPGRGSPAVRVDRAGGGRGAGLAQRLGRQLPGPADQGALPGRSGYGEALAELMGEQKDVP